MAIKDTYAELIIKQILQDLLLEGTGPTTAIITERFDDFVIKNDISKPLFDLEGSLVGFEESSSASLFNTTMTQIRQDLKVLYKHLFKISEASVSRFYKWRTASQALSSKLRVLEERIDTLLLLSSETAGYFNFVQDNFTDTSKVDLTTTTALVNIEKDLVTLTATGSAPSRVDLSDLTNEDITFTILSRNSFISTVAAQTSQRKNVVSDIDTFWQERVYFNKAVPVTAELKIDLKSVRTISRIDVNLHSSNQSSTMQLTPVYSIDNYNWKQLPINSPTRAVLDKTTFQFSTIQARWIKFVITKAGYDQVHNEMYAYEFGINQISFYNEGFNTLQNAELISQPLWVKGIDDHPEEFSRIALEVCEDIPDKTAISYYVGVDNDPYMLNTQFISIDPMNRELTTQPTVLDFGDLDTVLIEDIKVSYDATAAASSFRNPAETFLYLKGVTLGNAVTTIATASSIRYIFKNSNERILELQIAPSPNVEIANGSLDLWRNTVQRGVNKRVRNQPAGWRFEDPYFITTVYVDNSKGYLVDFGEQSITVDGSLKNGKIKFAQGKHKIGIHKNQWREIDFTSVTDEASLISLDSFYPYNHRYLVEGIDYPTDWSEESQKVYLGFDLMAECIMSEVSVFDLIHNVNFNDYNKFAVDNDLADSGRTLADATDDFSSTKVFLLKVDDANPDFLNEYFSLRFKSVNTLYKYLRFKAVLETSDKSIAPFLDSYRIKISS